MMLSPAPPPFRNSGFINQSINQSVSPGFTPTLNSEYFFNDDQSISPLLLSQTYDQSTNLPTNQSHNQSTNQSHNQSNYQSANQPINQSNDQFGIDSPPYQPLGPSHQPINQSINQSIHGRSIIEPSQPNQRSQSDAGAYQPINQSIFSINNPSTHQPADQSINQSINRPAVSVLTQPRPVRLAPPAVTQPNSPILDHASHNQSINHSANQTAPSSPVLSHQSMNQSIGQSIARPMSGQDGPLEYVGPFVLGPVLGRGCTGTVRLGTHQSTNFEVAFKIIEKKYLNSEPKLWKKVKREIAILKLIEHPFVLRLYDVLETEHRLYLVLEHVKGGELFDYIVSKGRLDRHESLRLTAQIVQGLEHCHAHSICHRDLKPENLLLDEKKNIKIADFGMAQLMKQNSILKTSCGSPHYASPEIIEGHNYDARVTDVWSIGVILYALITGSLPFDHDNIPTLLSMVTKGIYTTPAHVPSDVSHLISRMLTVDPTKRIKLVEIKAHPAFKGTSLFAPIRGESWPFNVVKQPVNQHRHSDPTKYRNVDLDSCDTSDASCESSEDENHVDDTLIADLEALGISSSTNREELKAKVASRPGQPSEHNNIERRFYHLLKKRRHSRLSQLSVLSPKVSPRGLMSNSYSIASSSTAFNGPFFHRAHSQPEAENHVDEHNILPGHTSAPSSRNVSSTRPDSTVTIAVTPEMIPAGHWVDRSTNQPTDLHSEIPISPLELDDDIGPPVSTQCSSYPPAISRLHSAPSPSRELDARDRSVANYPAAQHDQSAAQFYSRLAQAEPESPRGMPILIDSTVSSAPSSPSSGYGLTSPISASAPQTSMMSVVSAQVNAHRANQSSQQAVSLEPPRIGQPRVYNTYDPPVARRLFEGDGPEICIDRISHADPATRSLPLMPQSDKQSTNGEQQFVTTPRFHRVRVDPSLTDQSSTQSSHGVANLGSPVKKSSWFSSIFSGKTNLNLFARTNKSKAPKSPVVDHSASSRSSKPGLYSSKTTLTIADEVRRALKNSGIHYSMKQAGLSGGSRFECKVGEDDKKQAPPARSTGSPWSRRFSTTAMESTRRAPALNQSIVDQPKVRAPVAGRRGSVGTTLWGTAPLFSTNNNPSTHQSFNPSLTQQSPARPPRHRSRPASPVITPPNHTGHSSYLNPNAQNDYVINIAPSGGRSRANSDAIEADVIAASAPANTSNQHVRFVVEITHTNDHRCVRFLHVSGDEAQFRHWQQQISSQLHL